MLAINSDKGDITLDVAFDGHLLQRTVIAPLSCVSGTNTAHHSTTNTQVLNFTKTGCFKDGGAVMAFAYMVRKMGKQRALMKTRL